MKNKMRRSAQRLSKEECVSMLERNTAGVLALYDGDTPYAVPLSYVYKDNKIYFHSAKEGHKISAVRHCSQASFCVIDRDDIKPEQYTTYYRSVIAFGDVCIIEEKQKAKAAMQLLALKYNPDDNYEHRQKVITDADQTYKVLVLTISDMSGKEAIELIKHHNN